MHALTWFVRYGIGITLLVAGIVVGVISPGGFGIDGFALGAGAGGSVILFSFLFRIGLSGERERAQEEAAREYFTLHGRWPDDR
jgi:hypothetical protein